MEEVLKFHKQILEFSERTFNLLFAYLKYLKKLFKN